MRSSCVSTNNLYWKVLRYIIVVKCIDLHEVRLALLGLNNPMQVFLKMYEWFKLHVYCNSTITRGRGTVHYINDVVKSPALSIFVSSKKLCLEQ